MTKRFQFSIGQMLGATACFALAAWSWTYLSGFDRGTHPWFPIAVTAAGAGIGVLTGRMTIGMLVGFVFGVWLTPA